MKLIATAIAAMLLPSAAAFAQDDAHGAHHAPASIAAAEAALTHGEVRKIDKDAGKITLRHGRIENLDMPAMTMVFRAKDPSMLGQLNIGDSVLFRVERIEGALTITQLRKAS